MIQESSRRKQDLLIPVLLLVMVFLLAARTPLDTDLWWHLSAGQQTWESGRPMITDVFSFTRFGQTWINHSWLSQLILFGLYRLGGSLALSAWVAGLATLSMGIIYAQMRGPAIFRAFLVVLSAATAAVVWSPRPQLVSLVMFAGLSWVIYRFKWRKINQLWLLPVLFLFWSNLHGGWALGFMLIGILVAGEGLNHLLHNRSPEVLEWRQIGQLLVWGLISVPALVIHPNGLEILKIPFQTVEVQALQQFIQEWASPDFHELFQQPYLWLLLSVLAAFGLSGRKVDGSDLLAVVWFGALGLMARRNFGPFALVAAPILSRYLWTALRAWRDPNRQEIAGWGPGPEEAPHYRRRPRWQKVLNLLLVGGFTFAALVKCWVVSYPTLVESSTAAVYPVGAVQYLQQAGASGRVFNEYNWGGYLIWSDPKIKVFVDGRTDLYGDEILGEWMQIIQADQGWAEKLHRWQVDWVLVEPSRPLATAITNQAWKEVFRDEHSVLFQRSSGP